MHGIPKHLLTQKYFPIDLLLADEREFLRNASLLCPVYEGNRQPFNCNFSTTARHNRERLGHVLGT